jgi:hypothetical protein
MCAFMGRGLPCTRASADVGSEGIAPVGPVFGEGVVHPAIRSRQAREMSRMGLFKISPQDHSM